MTTQEFNETRFGIHTEVRYYGHIHSIAGVDFEKEEIALHFIEEDVVRWIPIINIDLIKDK